MAAREAGDIVKAWAILPSTEADDARAGELPGAHAARRSRRFVAYSFHVERDGHLVAGVTAWALGSDLRIDTLAADGPERRAGRGAPLLAHIEDLARRDGCTTANVDTFSFQEPDYYPAHGYAGLFRSPLDDGTERMYYSKRL